MKRKLWRYVGPGNGQGSTHMVLPPVDSDVVTWSIDPGQGGWSWMGPKEEFRKHFTMVES